MSDLTADDFAFQTKGALPEPWYMGFGVSPERTADALEKLAARIREGTSLPQSAVIRSSARMDDFTAYRLMLSWAEKRT